jgi:hypothetical protein
MYPRHRDGVWKRLLDGCGRGVPGLATESQPEAGTSRERRADFSPDQPVARYFDRRPITLARLLVRLVALLAVLFGADALATGQLHHEAFRTHYRLPEELSASWLPGYLHHLERVWGRTEGGNASTPVRVAFVGSSPTWGYRIKAAENTYPYAFESAAASAGVPVSAANLASNGQLVGDEYLVAKRVAPTADVVFVQLTYHTFSPSFDVRTPVRFPEIAKLPGLALSASESRLLRVASARHADVAATVGGAIADRSTLYRERDALVAKLIGETPEQLLFGVWDRRFGKASRDKENDVANVDLFAGAEFAAFDQLEPEQQMIVVNEYASNASFAVDPRSPHMRTLDSLARMLREDGVKAVFYMAPMNRDVIDSYALMDRAQYLANSKAIGDSVRAAGFPYIDYNTAETPVFPPEYFADIDHTTDAGGRAVGKRLFQDTKAYLRGADAASVTAGGSP